MSRETLQELVERLPAIAWVHQRSAPRLWVNRGFREFFARDDAMVTEAALRDRLYPADLEGFTTCLEKPAPFALELRARGRGGGWCWLDVRGQPRTGADGAVLGFVCVAIDVTSRRAELDALRRSEERLREAAAATGLGTYEYDIATERSYWSEELETITGVPGRDGVDPAEALLPFVHPEDRERLAAMVESAGAAQAPQRYEIQLRVRRPDGQLRWVRDTGKILFEEGRPVRAIGAVVDITEQEQAAQLRRIAADRDRLRTALVDAMRPLTDARQIEAVVTRIIGDHLAVSRVHYGELSPDLRISTVTADYAADVPSLIGSYRIDDYGSTIMNDLRAGNVLVISDAASDPRLTEPERERLAELEIRAFVVVPLVKERRPVAYLTVQDHRARDWSADAVAFIEEIAERAWAALDRARSEQALRASEERYRTLFKTIDQGFCVFQMIFDDDGKAIDYVFLETNPAFERHTGLVDAAGKRARAMVPDLEDHWPEIYGRVALTGEPHTFIQGSEAMGRWFEVAASRVGTPEERKVALLFTDISERRRAEEQLRLSAQRKDEYLAMLGHELRNPLGAITTAAELLEMMGSADAQVRRAYQILKRQSSHMSRIIDGLLDVSRIARGKINLELKSVDLSQIVRRIAEIWEPRLATHDLGLVTALPPDPVWITGDDARLVQVLDNLLGNAMKFSDPGQTITLTLGRHGGEARVSVRDTGVGIRKELLESIFESFHQETQDMARTRGGLGLGLALARGLVELHDGTITAHSAGPGEGAELIVHLPLSAAPRAAIAPRAASSPNKMRRILVVEDNEDAAELLREVLQRQGHEVGIVRTGREALVRLRAGRPDLVLCDLGLPGMSGHELARCVRADPELRDLRLVALTGYGQPEDRQRSADAGFDAHLVKPVDLDAVRDILARLG